MTRKHKSCITSKHQDQLPTRFDLERVSIAYAAEYKSGICLLFMIYPFYFTCTFHNNAMHAGARTRRKAINLSKLGHHNNSF